MKAQELRIGNFIEHITGTIEVDCDDFELIKNDPCEYMPIQLTEQWLIDFGFNELKTKSPRYFKKGIINVLKWKTNDFAELKIYRSDIGFTKIYSVHQLQNLYFALTGEELTLR